MIQPRASCFSLFMHLIPWAFCLALDSAGRSMAARIAMIAMTTKSSIKVKADGTVLGLILDEEVIFISKCCSRVETYPSRFGIRFNSLRGLLIFAIVVLSDY